MLSPHINAKHQDSLQQGWAGRKAVVVHPVPATTASEQPAPRKNREKDTCQGKKSSHINTLKICLLQDMTSILMDQEYINLFLKTCINLSKDAILLLVHPMQLHGTVFIIWAAYSYAMTHLLATSSPSPLLPSRDLLSFKMHSKNTLWWSTSIYPYPPMKSGSQINQKFLLDTGLKSLSVSAVLGDASHADCTVHVLPAQWGF